MAMQALNGSITRLRWARAIHGDGAGVRRGSNSGSGFEEIDFGELESVRFGPSQSTKKGQHDFLLRNHTVPSPEQYKSKRISTNHGRLVNVERQCFALTQYAAAILV